ncbi:MAG: hypothetical protein V2J07_01955 [Anaerolineae bacterium]|jgi:hypothetical protein|nr:hypothetical protein [Anaerolineae bacterium]
MDADLKRMAQASRIYDALLRCYPLSFQQEYGDTLAQQFRDEYRDVLASEKRLALFRFWVFIAYDFMRSLLMETQEEVISMFKPKFYMCAAIIAGMAAGFTFLFWAGPYTDVIEINFFIQLLIFPVLFLLMSALTLFGIVRATQSPLVFRILPILLLLSAFLFFPIPSKHPVRGWVCSTAIEAVGGNEDTTFGIIFPAYFILLMAIGILALAKKKWLPGASLLVICLPIVLAYFGRLLAIDLPFFTTHVPDWFTLLYGILSAVGWFVIAGWLWKGQLAVSPADSMETV